MEELNTGRVIVDFWAPWCGPCKMQKPQMQKFEEMQDEVNVVMINVDEQSEIAQKYGVRSIPTILYLEDGQEKARSIGLTDTHKLKEMTGIS
jgi:thioredoxin 1